MLYMSTHSPSLQKLQVYLQILNIIDKDNFEEVP